MIPLAYNWRSLVVRRSTTAASAFGMGLVVFVFASAMMLVNGVRQATRRTVDRNGAIVLSRGAAAEMESTIDAAHVATIATAAGVARNSAGVPRLRAS